MPSGVIEHGWEILSLNGGFSSAIIDYQGLRTGINNNCLAHMKKNVRHLFAKNAWFLFLAATVFRGKKMVLATGVIPK